MLYFKFEYPKRGTANEEKKQSVWDRVFCLIGDVLEHFWGDCNPDLAANSEHITTWYIEYDDVKYNLPIKEFGIDANGKVLFLAPSKRNRGFWCDEDLNIEYYKEKFDIRFITAEEFYGYADKTEFKEF